MPAATTLLGMPPKKNKGKPKDPGEPRTSASDGGKHQTPRRMVGMPLDWFKLAQELAREKPTPTVWWIIGLIKREAEAAGKPIPALPWETEDK